MPKGYVHIEKLQRRKHNSDGDVAKSQSAHV